MMHPEMLFVAHVHQPIVASPAVRVDDASRACLTQDPACSSFLEASGTISDTFPWRSRIPKTIVLPPAPRHFFREHGVRQTKLGNSDS